MRRFLKLLSFAILLVLGGLAAILAQHPEAPPWDASKLNVQSSPAQGVAIRAGRLFDPKSGTNLANQVILIKGDRITDVGPAVAIPSEARVIDLSTATVLPGMIDAHVHLFPAADNLSESTRTIVGVANAQTDLNAGFTTVLDMDSRGGFGTVDLRNAINRGLVLGPRMQVVGQSLNQRASVPYPALFERFVDRFTESKNANSPANSARLPDGPCATIPGWISAKCAKPSRPIPSSSRSPASRSSISRPRAMKRGRKAIAMPPG